MNHKISDFCYGLMYRPMHNNCRYHYIAISKYVHMTFRSTYCVGPVNILKATRIFRINNISKPNSIYNIRCKTESIADKSND